MELQEKKIILTFAIFVLQEIEKQRSFLIGNDGKGGVRMYASQLWAQLGEFIVLT